MMVHGTYFGACLVKSTSIFRCDVTLVLCRIPPSHTQAHARACMHGVTNVVEISKMNIANVFFIQKSTL